MLRHLVAGTLTIAVSFNQSKTVVALIIIQNDEQRSKLARMMIPDVLIDHGQVLIGKLHVEGGHSLNEVVGARPSIS